MQPIRQLPAQDPQMDSGPVQFGDDWPGVFIRGDAAIGFLSYLRMAQAGAPHGLGMLNGLADLLASSNLATREPIISDGYGNSWPVTCECGGLMQVVRPGKAQCSECG